MSTQVSSYHYYLAKENYDLESLVFTHKPNNISNEQYAKTHGFLFNTDETKTSKPRVISSHSIKNKQECIKRKFETDT